MNYKLSPSDFAFLYEDCKRCFYLKVVHGISRPSAPVPSIFTRITNLLKSHYSSRSTKELHPELPPGTIKYGERYVRSKLIWLPDRNATCFISGRFDIVTEFEDKTYGVIDFKTSSPNEKHIDLYSRQLHAYAYALENASSDAKLGLTPVTKMGLLYFSPTGVSQQSTSQILYESDIRWVEIDRDKRDFLSFVSNVLYVLEPTSPPDASAACPWCNYIKYLQKVPVDSAR